MRTTLAALLLASLTAAAAQPDATPAIRPTAVTFPKANATLAEFATEASKSPAGVTVTVDPRAVKAKGTPEFAGTPFWEALETAADRTKTRLVLRDGGRTVLLEPRPKEIDREVSAVVGPFRVVARKVIGTAFLDTGTTSHEVQLLAHWEPRMPVYRIDTHPKITRAEDDGGRPLVAGTTSAHAYPSGVTADLFVQLTGLTRQSGAIGALAGEFRATAAERMLAVRFPLGGKLPAEQTEAGVKVVLASFAKVGDTWNADLELTYPKGHPTFESFEEQKWLRDNRLRLVAPANRTIEPESEDVVASGATVQATYRFKVAGAAPGNGWSLVCETPGPLVEMKVPFTLKGIPIP
jgi:hypothetical protein